MVWCAINGLDIPVANGSWKEVTDDVTTGRRMSDHSWRGSLYAEKRVWEFETTPQTAATAEALKGWIRGRGHMWDFEGGSTQGQYSVEGGIKYTSSGTVAISTSNVKFGSRCLQLNSSATATFTTTFTGRWTWLVWKRVTSYTHFAQTYDGTTVTDYVSGAASSIGSWLTRINSPLTLTVQGENDSGTPATVQYDHMMLVPYQMTTAMIAASAARTAAEPNFPNVGLNGDCIEDLSEVTVRGYITDAELVQCKISGTFHNNARILTVRLVEV